VEKTVEIADIHGDPQNLFTSSCNSAENLRKVWTNVEISTEKMIWFERRREEKIGIVDLVILKSY
jgi:hypothetical protein